MSQVEKDSLLPRKIIVKSTFSDPAYAGDFIYGNIFKSPFLEEPERLEVNFFLEFFFPAYPKVR